MEHTNLINAIEILNTIKNTPGKKDKENIIKDNKDNEMFLLLIEFLCNKHKKTGIATKKLNRDIDLKAGEFSMTMKTVEGLLNFVQLNSTGSDLIIKSVQDTINTFPEETHNFLRELVTKTYKCGITSKTLNKAIPDTIGEFNVMLAEKYKKYAKLLDGNVMFIVTVKLDGIRVVLEKNEDLVLFKTRQGKIIYDLIELEEEAKLLPNGIYDGELIATGFFGDSQAQYKETMKRFAIKGKKTGLRMACFDFVNPDGFKEGIDNTPCLERKNNLRDILRQYNDDEEMIENRYTHFTYHDPLYIGTDVSAIRELFEVAMTLGEEGLMINIADAPYECKRTKNLLKYKEFQTADVLITEVLEGKGKFAGTLGSVTAKCTIEINNIEYPCISNVGGFTDEDRDKYWNNPELIVGKIAEIEFFEVSSNEKGTYSLRFAQWKDRIRIDKNTTHVD